MLRHYLALVHKDPESDYGISFPDFPGCVSAGDNPEEVCSMGTEALQFHVDGMLEEGEDIPPPTSLNLAPELLEKEGALLALLIPVKLPGKAKRVNITIEESLLADIDRVASSTGMSRSAFLAKGAEHFMAELKA